MIHPTSFVNPSASIGQNVRIGPFCVVGPKVTLGDNVELKSHVVVDGKTIIGDSTVIYPFASIGGTPQDLKYKGEDSEVIIGKNNSIREYVTIQPGTAGGIMKTTVGDECLFMVGAHIAHDCVVGSKVILANYASLAGHVCLGDNVRIGGLAAVHQHVRIGQHAIIGGLSGVDRDVIPFGLVANERAKLQGLNIVGINRAGFDKQQILEATKIIQEIFTAEGIFMDKVAKAQEKYLDNYIISQILEFLTSDTTRSFCQLQR